VADSTEELHEFAIRLGLRRAWFQHSASYPHYDVTIEVRTLALELGARAGTRGEIITCARKLKAELEQAKQPSGPEQLSLFCPSRHSQSLGMLEVSNVG